jgi:hypothetical protein
MKDRKIIIEGMKIIWNGLFYEMPMEEKNLFGV